MVEAHRRFLVSYLDGLVEGDLRDLWRLTVGFCDPSVDVRSFGAALAGVSEQPEHALVRSTPTHLRRLLTTGHDHARVASICRTFPRADTGVLRAMNEALLTRIRAFEQHEVDVVEKAGPTLLAALHATVDAVGTYYRRAAADARRHEIPTLDAAEYSESTPPDRGLPGHGGPLAAPTAPA